jgi:8-amino-7-oxononanoate synthase
VPETDGHTRELTRRLRVGLEALDRDGLRRSLRAPAGIDLSSNDYLGLSRHPLLQERMAAAVLEQGCGSTGSRLLRGERECFARLERRFARFKDAERALYFSSGYLANIAVLSTFAESGDVIFSDERNHASLIDGARLSRAQRVVFPHGDVRALERLMREHADGQAFVITESLFSMDGDFAPLRDLAAVCRACGAALIVDEAHAVGVYGPRGSGLIEEAGVGEDVFVSINTAGKALGVAGAFVAGSELAIETLVQRARPFIFSTAAPPAVAAALEASLDVIDSEPERRELLLARSRDLRKLLQAAGIAVPAGASQIIPISQIVSITLGDNQRAMTVAEAMQRAGFDVRAIRPPSVPHGTARLRVSVHADISEEALGRFVAALAAALSASETCAVSS